MFLAASRILDGKEAGLLWECRSLECAPNTIRLQALTELPDARSFRPE